jgi:hypothetical protein
MVKRLILTIIVLGFFEYNCISQNQFDFHLKQDKSGSDYFNVSETDTSDECNITLNDGTLLKDVSFLSSNDSMFTIVKNSLRNDFPISRLHKVIFEKHNFWTGFAIGVLGSVCFWEIIGLAALKSEPRGPGLGLVVGLICAPPVGLICGLVAEFGSKDDVYNFSTINPSSRANRLKNIILRHKQ